MAASQQDEAARLRELHAYGVLDGPADRELEDIVLLASQICRAPVAAVSFVDEKHAWLKARLGIDLPFIPRENTFCTHTIRGCDLLIVPDATRDDRFRDHPYVAGEPHVRFYAGAPLVSPAGHALGALCVTAPEPRDLTQGQADALRALARLVIAQLELRRTQERLRHDSLHDALTGLPNRVLFADRVERCIARTQREPNYRFALLFLDLDRFKLINDSLGHSTGDDVLRVIASRLQGCLRGTDSVSRLANEVPTGSGATESLARLGGDEFTILLDDVKNPDDPVLVAQRILAEISKPVQCGGHELSVTASIGIVARGGREASGNTDARELLRDADTAMYRAKGLGRNRYALFDSTLHAAAVARLKVETDLRRALERQELLLYYQPIISLETREPVGFEALIRWRHNDKLVSPADFIPVAEDTDLIVPIGAWVMEEACRQLAEWRRRCPKHPIWVSVNVSRRQLGSPDLVPHLKRVLRETGVPPSSLKLEITESVIMADGEAAGQTLAALRETGVRLAMDDFGTGYSSLSCLHKFPIDVLKIDRSFFEDLQERRDAAAVIQAIVHLAHNLGMSVVAEGLERLDQVAFLQTLDCDQGQGFVFAKPLPAGDAEKFLLTAPTALARSA